MPTLFSGTGNGKQDNEIPVDSRSHEIKDKNKNVDGKIKLRKKRFENAFIGGISGGLLSACLSNEIPCTALLIPTSTGIPDP